MGIGALLRDGRLTVPPNQRSYAWEDRHVTDLLQDFNEAIGKDGDEYFLGSVVLIQSGDGTPTIADGQQRLATITIHLSRIRDHLERLGRAGSAQSIDVDFIRSIDRDTEETIPRLTLNVEDNEFFSSRILPNLDPTAQSEEPIRASNRRLVRASRAIDDFIRSILGNLPGSSHPEHLLKWVRFVEKKANIIVVRVTDDLGAFRIFETLNDRGLRASQADLLKNYFLSKAGGRLNEAHSMWNATGAALETVGEDDSDLLVTYIRHLWITSHGPTKERELAEKIKSEVGGSARAIEFLSEANKSTLDYVSLWSPRHPKWNDYLPSTKHHVETISHHLQVEPDSTAPLCGRQTFDVEEADKAFKLFVSWSVRFLIYGGRGGLLDTQYSLRAQDVGTGRIKKARELRESMERHVPTDRDFEDAFASARVSRTRLARYYLRALEKTAIGKEQPEYVSNEEAAEINLEHVLPLQSQGWGVDDETARSVQRALGNMALLPAALNAQIGDASFEEKKAAYAQCDYLLTKSIADKVEWGPEQIRERQRELASLAVRTWPLTFK